MHTMVASLIPCRDFSVQQKDVFKITCYKYSTMENEIQISPDSLLTFFSFYITLLTGSIKGYYM